MKCLNCGKEFEPIRSTAKFDSEKCKKQYQRNSGTKDVPVKVLEGQEELIGTTEDVSGTKKEKPSFVPNWKRTGHKSKQEALMFVLAALGENKSLTGEVFHLGDTSWEVRKDGLKRIA